MVIYENQASRRKRNLNKGKCEEYFCSDSLLEMFISRRLRLSSRFAYVSPIRRTAKKQIAD